ncbi:hypothetical protein F511_30668 [Dorcoceras hygrometricum]|uniref:Uncharacterized protein n=1 Tax=Dorcoceras hygrometricum TaxID=472368 RepID=A0A2Z7ALE8_9LAMI|nr:hypothetical protein F511_30668 [Dorcoceras hygrometricum]
MKKDQLVRKDQLEQKLRRVAIWSWNDKAAGALSIDDVISSDITISRKIYQQRASTNRGNLKLAIAKRCRSNKLSQDDVPVASYSGSSRKLQCFAYPVAGNPDAGKAEVAKNCNQVQSIQSSKKPDAVMKNQPAAKQLTNYEELLKLDVNF